MAEARRLPLLKLMAPALAKFQPNSSTNIRSGRQ